MKEIIMEVPDRFGQELKPEKVNSEIKGELIRCMDCRYWQDNNGGYPHPDCRWREDETPDPDDYCSFGEVKRDDEKRDTRIFQRHKRGL